MPTESALTIDRLEMLLRDALSRYGPERGAMSAAHLTEVVRRCGTGLEGVGAAPVFAVPTQQVREQLRVMPDVLVTDFDTPSERFRRRPR